MKVIRMGTVPVLKERRFTCQRCGCVFEAGPEEYRLATNREQVEEGLESRCECPCCGMTVRRYMEDKPETSTGRFPKCGGWLMGVNTGYTRDGTLVIDYTHPFCPGCGYGIRGGGRP